MDYFILYAIITVLSIIIARLFFLWYFKINIIVKLLEGISTLNLIAVSFRHPDKEILIKLKGSNLRKKTTVKEYMNMKDRNKYEIL